MSRHPHHHHRHDDPAAIEDEIENTRARLDRTIDALEDKLSPVQLLGQVLSLTKAGGGELAGGLASAARTHPMPVTLLSLGAGWLMMADRQRKARAGRDPIDPEMRESARTHMRGSANVHEWASEAGASALRKTHDLQDKAKAAATAVQHHAHDLADKARAEGAALRGQATQMKDTVMTSTEENIAWLQQTAEKLLQENPLAAGALMMAAGALMGGALPVTEAERRLLGGKGEQAKTAAAKALERGSQAVQDIAGAALDQGHQIVEDVSQEMRKQEEPALH